MRNDMTFKNELEKHLDDHFPKGECLERGAALVLYGEAVILARKAVADERQRVREKTGMLRQWLNEDRITDTTKMVTNEDIEYWLSLDKSEGV